MKRTGHIWVVGLLLLAGSGDADQDGATPGYRSPIHISLAPNGTRAYVVNQTSDSVSIVDVGARAVIGEIPVGPHPEHAALAADGRTLYVTSRYGNAVDVVDLEHEYVVRSIPTGLEPCGVTLSADGRTLYVANSQSDTVSFVDVASDATRAEVPVGREPRYVAETADGSRLIVAESLSRGVSIIDVGTARLVESRPLGRASLMREVALSPDGAWAFAAHVVSRDDQNTLQMERGFIHANGFSVVDLSRPGRYVTILLDRLLEGAANPWGVALSSDGRLYVSLAGVHEVAIADVEAVRRLVNATPPAKVAGLAEDVEALEKHGFARRVDAGGIGPRGLALNETTGELLVANYFSDTVSVLDAATGAVQAVIPLGPPVEMTPRRRGHMLFNDARLCFQKWFSCASCHQEDATVDGLNWDLANDGTGNPKNAKSLHDIGDTPPAMWTGVRRDMTAAVAAGQRFLGSIPDPENHRALLAYLETAREAPNPYRHRDAEAVVRGAGVFLRARCHACHPAPTYTDGIVHDVGLANPTDHRLRFDTPSLRECCRTAPYLHDGRAKTLREIFTEHNALDLHGRTGGLSEQELEDLLAFLRSL